jgi:uncharacterized membrane protein YGL010W
VYCAAVPLTVLGTVGVLWSLPVPVAFADISPLLNWGSAFLMAATVYYFILSLSLAIGLLPLMLAIGFLEAKLGLSEYSQLQISAVLLAAGLVGLWVGQRGKRSPATVVEDVQTVMLGPPWLLSVIYRRLGIPY